MGKKKKKIDIPDNVKQLGMAKKKFAKKNDLPYKMKGKEFSKKEKKNAVKEFNKEYASAQLEALDKAVKILVQCGMHESKKIDKLKERVDEVIRNQELMDGMISVYKKEPKEYKWILHLPGMITATILYYQKKDLTDEEKKEAEHLDVDMLMKFCEKILRKPIRKYMKHGLSASAAFQMACAVPTLNVFTWKTNYWHRKMINTMFEIAAEDVVDVPSYLQAIFSMDKNDKFKKKYFLDEFCLQYLLRKQTNKSAKFTDNQKELQENLNAWVLVHLNTIQKDRSRAIIKDYIKARKRAEENKVDGTRVIPLINHSNANSEYTRLRDVLLDIIKSNSQNELYLG